MKDQKENSVVLILFTYASSLQLATWEKEWSFVSHSVKV